METFSYTVGMVTNTVGFCEDCMVCSQCRDSVVASLTLSRCAIDHNHKWFVYILFGYYDFSWAYKLILVSLSATEEGYVLSYGQVWLPLFAFGGRTLTNYLPV